MYCMTLLNSEPMTAETAVRLRTPSIRNRGIDKGRTLKIIGDGSYTNRTRAMLYEFYTPFNIKLAQLLQDPWFLSWNIH